MNRMCLQKHTYANSHADVWVVLMTSYTCHLYSVTDLIQQCVCVYVWTLNQGVKNSRKASIELIHSLSSFSYTCHSSSPGASGCSSSSRYDLICVTKSNTRGHSTQTGELQLRAWFTAQCCHLEAGRRKTPQTKWALHQLHTDEKNRLNHLLAWFIIYKKSIFTFLKCHNEAFFHNKVKQFTISIFNRVLLPFIPVIILVKLWLKCLFNETFKVLPL